MFSTLMTVANYLFSWTVISVMLCWLLAVSYSFFARSRDNSNAVYAAFFTFIYGLLAPAAAVVSLIVLSLPKLAFFFISDHCHENNCSPHALYTSKESLAGVLTVAIGVTLLTSIFTLMLFQFFSSRQKLCALSHLSENGSSSYRLVDTPAKVAWCAGLFKPVVYLSRGLLESLTPHQVQLILAHELTHVQRRDNLRKWVMYWSTIVWPKRQKMQIRQDLSRFNEQVCDLAAARSNQGQLDLAGVIDTLENCYANSNSGNRDTSESKPRQQRVSALQRELTSQINKNSGHTASSNVLVGAFTFGSWFIAIILAIHFGHPLMEWLSS